MDFVLVCCIYIRTWYQRYILGSEYPCQVRIVIIFLLIPTCQRGWVGCSLVSVISSPKSHTSPCVHAIRSIAANDSVIHLFEIDEHHSLHHYNPGRLVYRRQNGNLTGLYCELDFEEAVRTGCNAGCVVVRDKNCNDPIQCTNPEHETPCPTCCSPGFELTMLLNPDGLTLESVGAYFGVTRERIRQIQVVALDKLLLSTEDTY